MANIETTVRRAETFWDVHVSRPPYGIDSSHCADPYSGDCRPTFSRQVVVSRAFRVDLSTGEVTLFVRAD